MQSLINRALEGFLRDSYGDVIWGDIVQKAAIDPLAFISRNRPRSGETRRVVQCAARRLHKPLSELLEDLGGWLVRLEPIRRLLRFSGSDYGEFVLSLNELQGRARMILPALNIPAIRVLRQGDGWYRIDTDRLPSGWGHVLSGALRGMADDYGTLALIGHETDWIDLRIALIDHGANRPFHLSYSWPKVIGA